MPSKKNLMPKEFFDFRQVISPEQWIHFGWVTVPVYTAKNPGFYYLELVTVA